MILANCRLTAARRSYDSGYCACRHPCLLIFHRAREVTVADHHRDDLAGGQTLFKGAVGEIARGLAVGGQNEALE